MNGHTESTPVRGARRPARSAARYAAPSRDRTGARAVEDRVDLRAGRRQEHVDVLGGARDRLDLRGEVVQLELAGQIRGRAVQRLERRADRAQVLLLLLAGACEPVRERRADDLRV